MQNLFDRLAAVALGIKLGVLVAIIALLGGGYYYFFYSDMVDEKEQLIAQGEKLDKEKKEYEKRKVEYLAFRNEVNSLLEEQKELLRVLPKRDDIEQFIESVQSQIELAGLSKVSSIREAAAPVEMYVKIPIRMSLVGTYHQINHFFKNVGELKRIVNIEDLNLQPNTETIATSLTAPVLLKANFVATTFQFQEKASPGSLQQKAGGTSITSGGGK
ncbi:MAG TPA: type 4a pilus biogenesis protein PilO [Polyangia bacterium]|nr:type 4a pilus biogenesis protein PilO [Polyangia bacterium]